MLFIIIIIILVQQRVVDFKICLLVYKCLHQLAAHTSCRWSSVSTHCQLG